MKRRYFFLTIEVTLSLLIMGCSLQDRMLEVSATHYQHGLASAESHNYDAALQHFRMVPPDSPNYKNALNMVRQIPLQRGQSALERKDYRVAIHIFNTIPMEHPDYKKAKELKTETVYQIRLEDYHNAPKEEKHAVFQELMRLAAEDKQEGRFIQIMDLIVEEVSKANSTAEVMFFIQKFQSVLEIQKNPKVSRAGLQRLLTIFRKFQSSPPLRVAIFQLIANLKLQLQEMSL